MVRNNSFVGSLSMIATLVPLCLVSPVDGANEWPAFRGSQGMGVAEGANPPVEWSSTKNLQWKRELPGPGASSPITWENHIYVTCYSGYFVPGESEGKLEDLKRHLIALDRKTGDIAWERTIPAKLPEEERIRDHGFAANTPAADKDHVYVFFGKSGVLAFDHDGNEKWRADVGSSTSGWGTAASPILYKEMVIVNASVESESLVALERTTGKEIWSASDITESWNTPLLVDKNGSGLELIVSRHGNVLGFDPDSGKSLWSSKTDIGWYMVPTAVAADGIVYYLGGRSGTAAGAVKIGGNGDVTDSHRIWIGKNGSNVSSPILHDGHLYWVNDSQGIAFCANAATGKVVYQERLHRAGQFYSSPILAAGRLYYVGRDGRTFVIAGKPTSEQLSINELRDGSTFDGSPAADGNRLLIRSGKFLYCVGES